MTLLTLVVLSATAVGLVRWSPRRPVSRSEAMRALGGAVARARVAANNAPDPVADTPDVHVLDGRRVVAMSAVEGAAALRRHRRTRSMTPAAIAARRARADRRGRDAECARGREAETRRVVTVVAHDDWSDPWPLAGPPAIARGRAVPRRRVQWPPRELQLAIIATGLVVLGLASTVILGGRHRPSAAATTARPVASTEVTSAPAAAPTSFRVGLTATDACWIRAVDSVTGDVVAEQVVDAGGHLDIDAHHPLALRLGKPSAVAISVDGRPMTLEPSTTPVDLTVAPSGVTSGATA